MRKEPPNPLRRAEQYHAENLALARQILATDEEGLRREWAELVVAKEESDEQFPHKARNWEQVADAAIGTAARAQGESMPADETLHRSPL